MQLQGALERDPGRVGVVLLQSRNAGCEHRLSVRCVIRVGGRPGIEHKTQRDKKT